MSEGTTTTITDTPKRHAKKKRVNFDLAKKTTTSTSTQTETMQQTDPILPRPKVVPARNHDSRSRKTLPNKSILPPEQEGVPIYFKIIEVGTGSFCTKWWSDRPYKERVTQTITIPRHELIDLKDGNKQIMYWAFEYICPTSKQIVSGPTGIDLCSLEGNRTIYWKPVKCGCKICAETKPYQKKVPGYIMNHDEQIIQCGDPSPATERV